jgi:hypothetical protein
MLGSGGAWIARRALVHMYDRTPTDNAEDPYYGVESDGRTITDQPCLWIAPLTPVRSTAAEHASRDPRGDRPSTTGPCMYVPSTDTVRAGDRVSNIRDDDVVWAGGPFEVLGVEPISPTLRIVTLSGIR